MHCITKSDGCVTSSPEHFYYIAIVLLQVNKIANYITIIIIIMLTNTHNITVMSLVPIGDIAIPASALLFQNHCQ